MSIVAERLWNKNVKETDSPTGPVKTDTAEKQDVELLANETSSVSIL